MSSAYKIGGMVRTEPGPKGITDWCIHDVDDVCVYGWGIRDDGGIWTSEPIGFIDILVYHDPPE